jgi:carbon monoxide dehydrogenase subunit G
MPRYESSVDVNAAPEAVFAALADIPGAPTRIGAIKKVEMLTEGPVRVGTRFRETRVMFGKEATETMEVAEIDPPRRITMVADSCGTAYRTSMNVRPAATGSTITWSMEATPHSTFARILSPLMGWMMSGMVRKCVAQDLADIAKAVTTPRA